MVLTFYLKWRVEIISHRACQPLFFKHHFMASSILSHLSFPYCRIAFIIFPPYHFILIPIPKSRLGWEIVLGRLLSPLVLCGWMGILNGYVNLEIAQKYPPQELLHQDIGRILHVLLSVYFFIYTFLLPHWGPKAAFIILRAFIPASQQHWGVG